MAETSRRVFITGGGSGIGLAVARAFAARGHQVMVAGRDAARLEATGFPFAALDATDEAALADAVRTAGPIDVMIAGAGAAETAPALDISRDHWDRMIAVNLTGVYLSARCAVPQMAERGWGRFIAIASTASLKGYPYAGAYVAAKHGVLGWIRTLALELAKTGVTANAICPGFSDTGMIDRAIENIVSKTGRARDEAKESFLKNNPMKRLVAPAEVADAALWLAGDAAASVNGQAIAIDGGETAS